MGSDGKLTWERTSGKGNVARVTGNALPRTHGALLYENSGSPDVSRAIDALAKHASNKGQFAQIHWNDHVVEVAPAPKGNVQAQKINADAADRVFWREVNLRR